MLGKKSKSKPKLTFCTIFLAKKLHVKLRFVNFLDFCWVKRQGKFYIHTKKQMENVSFSVYVLKNKICRYTPIHISASSSKVQIGICNGSNAYHK